MYKDCRNCLKIDHCNRHIECTLDGKFLFWSGLIEGEILSATQYTMYVRHNSDEKTYILGTMDQVNPGFFRITQNTETF